jgi:PIN domain nuclease of toxin-antitoxin system
LVRDRWDRILAAQAIKSGGILVTKDRTNAALGVKTFW